MTIFNNDMKKLVVVMLLVLASCSAKEKELHRPSNVNEDKHEIQEIIKAKPVEPLDVSKKEVTETDPKKLLKLIQDGTVKFDFYASFTEPFYVVYFLDDRILMHGLDFPAEFYRLKPRFNPNVIKQILHYTDGTESGTFVVVKNGKGSDGMSDITYSYEVRWGDLTGGGEIQFQTEK